MKLAYYPGCSLKQSSALYDVQCRQVFGALGITLTELEDWNCCGATSAAKVDDFLAVALSARNLGIAEASGYDQVVIPCSACYSKTMVAQQRLRDDSALRDEINAGIAQKVNGKVKVASILEALLETVHSGSLKKRVQKKFRGLNPVCYYGCMLTRFPYNVSVPDDVENPQGMEIVLKVLGANPLDWNSKTACCGASAAVNDHQTSLNLMGKIMQDAVSRGADCMVVTCPMCQLNMDAWQETFCQLNGIHERLPVYFLTELIGLAIGMNIEELQIDRHFTDSTTLVKELGLI
ncbi:CoB--CoM heterodisulfide reductase iron-sulfur subunit B family protein [Desulfococcaceae bacterium HSG7]|nr:CoB--CoM heterodisulfide reductase iron-sulfur subunit B family protein [Desulfococcaceae bacterium HSG7]